jgi:lipoprotein-anchoring transpeptidase ErfK/SrfK
MHHIFKNIDRKRGVKNVSMRPPFGANMVPDHVPVEEMPTVRTKSVKGNAKRRNLLTKIGVPLAIIIVAAAALLRFGVLTPTGTATPSNARSPFADLTATPYNQVAPIQQGNLAQSGQIISGVTPYPTEVNPNFPDPRVDSAVAQSWRAKLSGNPQKVIMVSLAGQFMQAFENGKLVRWTYITSGKSELPTPQGIWSIGWKKSPFTFEPISTDPNDKLWFGYPSKVQYALEFHDGGFMIHDTWWRTVYGPTFTNNHWDPGRQEYQDGSHGCVNTPLEYMIWLYVWADVGTPVIVY